MMKDIKFMGAATVGSKGQIVVPQEVREQMNIKTGDRLVILASPQKAGFMAVKPEVFDTILSKMGERFTNLEKLRQDVKNTK